MLKRLSENKGSALVEVALTTPLLLMMTIGAAELGRIAYAAIEVQNAARAGAAYGSTNIVNAYQTASIKQAAENDAPNITLSFPTDPTQYCVCETITTTTSNGSTSSTISYTPGGTTPAPILCDTSPGVLNSDFDTSNCDTDTSTQSQQVVEYVQVETQATVDTMFHYQTKLFGLPTSFTLSGLSSMRVLQN